jgi:uncharacterized protein
MKYAALIIRFKYVVITIVITTTIFMAYSLKDLTINADVLSYLPENDPSAELFIRLGESYGGNSIVIVGLSGKEVFEPEMLGIVKQITDSLRRVAGIGYVTSLTNVIDIRGSDHGIEIGRLIDEYDIPSEQVTLDSLKAYTLSEKMYRGNLVSEDATATLVIGKILNGYNHDDIVKTIRDKLSGLPFEDMIYYGGMPVTLYELSRIIRRDINSIAPLAFIMISLMLLAGFRNFRGVALPMLTVLIAIIWTMGLITILGYEITMLTNIIPVILLAVGSAYAIHVINAVTSEYNSNSEDALQRAVGYITLPVILAGITTILGFVSFIAGSYLVMITEFGVFSAAGILFSMILSISFVPAVMAVLDKSRNRTATTPKITFFDRIPAYLAGVIFKHKTIVIIIWAAIFAVSVYGMTMIERRVDLVDYFKKDNIVRKGEELLKGQFNGSNPLYVNFQGNVQHPDLLKLMSETQDYMDHFYYIPYSQSVADLIKQMNDAMGEGKIVPDDEIKIAQLWFLLEGQEIMEQLVSPDLSEGVIQAYVTSGELDVLTEIESDFGEYVSANSTEDIKMSFTGIPVMLKRLDESLIRSQTYSLIIAMVLVILMVSALLGSLKRGLTAVVPIGLALVVLFGLMGMTRTPLDIATVLSGSVTIGIGIDYAIHFISRFSEGRKLKLDMQSSLERSIRISGKAIFINMLSVSAGFAMLAFSNLVPLQRFGILLAFTMIVSGMASLTLLPLILIGDSLPGRKTNNERLITRNQKSEINNQKLVTRN